MTAKIKIILLISLIFLTSGCSLWQKQTAEEDQDIQTAENEIITIDEEVFEADIDFEDSNIAKSNNPVSCINNYQISKEDISRFFSEKKSSNGGNTLIFMELVPTDALFDNLIQKYNICLNPNEKYIGIDEQEVLRIKAYMLLVKRMSELSGSDANVSIQKNDRYVFLLDPQNTSFTIFKNFDSKQFNKLSFEMGYLLSDVEFFNYQDSLYFFSKIQGKFSAFKDVDIASFEMHSNIHGDMDRAVFFTDATQVYFIDATHNFIKIEGANPKIFTEKYNNFFIDDNFVYYYNSEKKIYYKIEDADPVTFTVDWGDTNGNSLIDTLRTDGYSAFYYDYDFGSFKKIKDLDLNTVEFLYVAGHKTNIFRKDNSYYYFTDTTPTPVKIVDVPKGTKLESTSPYSVFFTDGSSVYVYIYEMLRLEKLDMVDYMTLVILNSDPDELMFKDKNGVYVVDIEDNNYFKQKGTFIKKLNVKDPSSFKILTDPGAYNLLVAKDTAYVYTGFVDLKPKSAIDAQSFEIILDTYGFVIGKDKNNIYAGRNDLEMMKFIDLETFEVISGKTLWPYAQDKKHVYYVGRQDDSIKIIENADPSTFHILGRFNTWYYYATDNVHVWFYDNNEDIIKLIPGVDPKSFDAEEHAKKYFK